MARMQTQRVVPDEESKIKAYETPRFLLGLSGVLRNWELRSERRKLKQMQTRLIKLLFKRLWPLLIDREQTLKTGDREGVLDQAFQVQSDLYFVENRLSIPKAERRGIEVQTDWVD